MPRLSILVPLHGSHELLEQTLVSVLENRPDDCEVLVLHRGDYNDPYDLADEVRFVVQPAAIDLIGLLNEGIKAARGDVLHPLLPGITVINGWTEAAIRHFDDPQIGLVSPFVLQTEHPDRLMTAGVGYGWRGARCERGTNRRVQPERPVKRVLGPTLRAGFFRAAAVKSLHGFDPTMGETLADVDLALSLKSLGYEARVEPESQVCANADTLFPTATTPFSHSRRRERLFWRYAAETGWIKSLLSHPFALLGDLIHPTGLLGRAVACLEFLGQVRFRRRLQNALRPEDISQLPTGSARRLGKASSEMHGSLAETRAA